MTPKKPHHEAGNSASSTTAPKPIAGTFRSRMGVSDPLESAVDKMRQAAPRPGEPEEAGARVWARLSAMVAGGETSEAADRMPDVETVLRECADYAALMPAYLDGRLPGSRTLLFEDHVRECFHCRRKLDDARGPRRPTAPAGTAFRRRSRLVWAGLAATAAAALVVGSGTLVRILFPIETGAVAASVTGRLFRVADSTLVPMAPGDRVGAQTAVRTASDSGALLELTDGSRVELGERTEISLVPAADGIRIDVGRGNLIVRAAPQGDGHLYVSTDDVDVEVVGTIFSVNEGSKGARVSVIEGEVRVVQSAMTRSLFPGEQYTTSEALTTVPIEEEIAWSQESGEYVALVEALSGIEDEIRASASGPEVRFDSALLDRVPASTTAYVAFPNLARTISTAYDVFIRRMESSTVTREWWDRLRASEEFDPADLDTMIGFLRSLSDQVGDEVVLALAVDGDRTDPVVMTTVTDASLMADLLGGLSALGEVPFAVTTTSEELAALEAAADSTPPIAFVGENLLAFSTSAAALIEVADTSPSGSGFVTREFYSVIREAYDDGVDWLFAADLDRIVVDTGEDPEPAVAGFLGLEHVDDVLVEHKTVAGTPQTRALMTFSGERTGVASWIREAGPMGSLEFVSPEAVFVTGGLTRDAESVVREILGLIERVSADAWNQIEEFQAEHRFDIEYDLASTFGGEFVLAIDGPLLPTPSWKLVAEVYNSAILQTTIERLVFEVNRVAVPAGHPPMVIEAETVGGQIFYTLRFSADAAIHYTFSGGYLIAGPNPTLVSQALQYQQTRLSLAASSEFRNLMPAGGENHCSAVAYQNVASAFGGLDEWLGGQADGTNETDDTNETFSIFDALGALDRPATLVCVVAGPDRIVALNEGESPFAFLELGGASIFSRVLTGTEQ